jgi:hypothetical protein
MGYLMEQMPGYVKALFDEERESARKGIGRRNNFLSLLLQLSDEERRSGQSEFSLSDKEISGSLFVRLSSQSTPLPQTTVMSMISNPYANAGGRRYSQQPDSKRLPILWVMR